MPGALCLFLLLYFWKIVADIPDTSGSICSSKLLSGVSVSACNSELLIFLSVDKAYNLICETKISKICSKGLIIQQYTRSQNYKNAGITTKLLRATWLPLFFFSQLFPSSCMLYYSFLLHPFLFLAHYATIIILHTITIDVIHTWNWRLLCTHDQTVMHWAYLMFTSEWL